MSNWEMIDYNLVFLGKGKKTTKDKKIIEIEIDKGAPSDFRKVFYGEVTSRINTN